MILALVDSDLKTYVLEATRTWHVQHEFSNCVCDLVFIRHKDNFLTGGMKQTSNLCSFQSFGSWNNTKADDLPKMGIFCLFLIPLPLTPINGAFLAYEPSCHLLPRWLLR